MSGTELVRRVATFTGVFVVHAKKARYGSHLLGKMRFEVGNVPLLVESQRRVVQELQLGLKYFPRANHLLLQTRSADTTSQHPPDEQIDSDTSSS